MMVKNVKRKAVAIALTLTLSLGSAVPMAIEGLTDLGDFYGEAGEVYGAEVHWADPYMNKLLKEGVMRGDKAGNLNPESGITRAEFLAMINRSFGYTKKGAVKFADVPLNAWYADDVGIAAQQGYFTGAEDNLAKPEETLKREEAVTLLCRALKIEGITEDNYNFVDSRDFSYWSKEFIHAATIKQYISGYPDQTFRPSYDMKRGEMARVLADATGDIVQTKGNTSAGYTPGNVTLNTSGTTLKDTTVPGDLYVTGGVGLGYTMFENVTVLGDLIISGAGESNVGDNSIVIKDSKIRNMIVDSSNGKKLSVRAEGTTEIEKTIVKSATYLEEGNTRYSAFKDIELNGTGNMLLQMSGIFDNVTILGEKNQLSLLKGYISRLVVDETAVGATINLEKDAEVEDLFLDVGTSVKGLGKIKNVVIAANGCNISMLPENIEIRPGVTATINGKPMTSADAELNALKPEIVRGPTFDNAMPTAIDAVVAANKPGKVYWVVRKESESSPTLTQMMTPKKEDGIKFGNLAVIQDKDTTIKISGLVAGTKYKLYTVLVDLRNKNSTVGSSGFSTVDNVAPKFVVGTPTVEAAATSAAIKYTATKDATAYWAVTEAAAPAPNAADLANAGSFMVGKVVRGEATSAKEVEKTINTNSDGYTQTALDEGKTYSLYIVLKDYAGNYSAVTKMPLSMSDITAPKFAPSYPTFNSTAATSLTMKFKTDEPATIYFAAFVSGAPFPNPAAKPNPDLTTASAIQAVINGNIGVKSGKVNSTGNIDGTVNISGLEAKKMYDVYVVLEDKSKNKNASKVFLFKDNALVDKTIPTATLSFKPDYNGRPKTTSNIIMTFDKVIYDTVSNERLSKISAVSAAALDENIKLYDKESTDPIGKEVNIDFAAVKTKIEDKNSQTVITFNLTPGNLSFALASGSKYQFELLNLADVSGNLISPAEVIRLNEFTTVPPQINLNVPTGSDIDFDLVIELELQESSVALSKAYDTLIKSNATATFDIYSTTGSGITSPGAVKEVTGAMVERDKTYSLTRLIKGGGTNASTFEPFENLPEKRIYGIVFTILEANGNKPSWQGMASFEVQGLIGAGESLYKIAAAPKIFAPTDSMLLKENVQVVSNPISKVYEKPFMDSVVPKFVSNTPTMAAIGDSAVLYNVMLDSPAKIWWVLAEKGKIAKIPSAQQIILGQPRTEGGQNGSLEVISANVLTDLKVEGLKPAQEYVLYMTPKGNPPESEVTMAAFKTKIVSKPIIKDLSMVSSGNEKVDASVKVDATSKVYWIAYPASDKPIKPEAQELIDRTNITKDKAVSWGDFDVVADVATPFEIRSLKEEQKYNVYATATNPPYSLELAEVVSLSGITSSDTIPPSVKTTSTSITSAAGAGTPYPTFTGKLSVVFNENLYYLDATTARKALTKFILEKEFKDPAFKLSKATGENADKAISALDFEFTNVPLSRAYNFSFDVCDKSNNNIGKLVFTLMANKEEPNLPNWDVRFTGPPRL